MSATLTQIDLARRQQRIICKMLHWDDLRYLNFLFEAGMEYLEIYTKDDEMAVLQLGSSKVFWAWWRNHWTLRDQQYVADAQELERVSMRVRRQMYRALHMPRLLADEIYPNAVVLGESYAEMIGKAHKTMALKAE